MPDPVLERSLDVPPAKPNRILLGQITGVNGLKGDLVVRTYTAEPEDIASYGVLSDAAGKRTFEITSVRVTTKAVIVRIKGVVDRTAAEMLRGTELYVDRDALPEVDDGAYYHTDLIGLAAVDTNGVAIGKVVSVQNFGAGDLLEIKCVGQSATELVPFTDACVPHVDITKREVVVIIPQMVGEPEPAASDPDDEHRDDDSEE